MKRTRLHIFTAVLFSLAVLLGKGLQAQSITSFSPAYACTGSTVTITGGGFTGASAVLFGGVPAASYTVVNDATITATVTNGYSGLISVVVNGSTLSSSNEFIVAGGATDAYVVSSSSYNSIQLYNKTNNALITSIPTSYFANTFLNNQGTKAYRYYGNPNGHLLEVVNLISGKEKTIFNGYLSTSAPTESPDRKKIYFPTNNTVSNPRFFYLNVVDAIADTLIRTITVETSYASDNISAFVSVAVSPDNSTIYHVCAFTGNLTVIDATTLSIVKTVSGFAGKVIVSADGKTLYAGNGKDLRKYDLASGTSTNTAITTLTSITSMVQSADGNTIYANAYKASTKVGPKTFPATSNIIVYNVADNTYKTLTPNFSSQLNLSLSADGITLIGVSQSTGAKSFSINTTTFDTSSVTFAAAGSDGVFGKVLLPCTPTITSFTPAKACPGSTVSITGSALSRASAITIGGVPVASFTVKSDTSITAITGAKTTGYIAITTPAGMGTSTDSIASAATTATLTQSAKGSYTWHGTNYTASGVYTFDSLNVAGCDSLTTLNLTILPACTPTSSTDSINACTSYTWHGTTYTASGAYTYTITNAAGCDSIATLKLHLKVPIDVVTVSGNDNTCVDGKTSQLTSNFTGGLWFTKSTSITVNSNGLVAGNGTINAFDTVKYYCSTDSATLYFSYLPYTVIGSKPITGYAPVCTGATLQLQTKVLSYAQNIQNGTTGAWSVQNTARGTITSAGLFTAGSTGGHPNVVYTLINKLGCSRNLYDTSIVINPLPTTKATISGPTSVCTQSTVQLSATPTGTSNTWGVQNTIRGSISNSGLLTGASPNANAIVTYKYTDNNGCSSPTAYYNVYVNVSAATPRITTLSGTYCVGNSYNFAATPVGGTWSTNNAIASITSSNTSAAIAKINSAGSFGIIYNTLADVNGCKATTTFVRNTSNCTATTVILDTLQNTNESARVQASSVSVYPNPARGVVTVNSPSVSASISYAIADITGKVVKTQAITDKQTKVNISGLKSGIYFISIQSAEGKTTKKLIINN